jgi:hypothetical protein
LPEVVAGSQYGIVNTPSYIQCNGINRNSPNDFEVLLSTNASITNCLEEGKFYLISGKLITTKNVSLPVITYNQNSPAIIPVSKGADVSMIDRVAIVGMGHVVSSTEVSSDLGEDLIRLEVIVAHNDWDSRVCIFPSIAVIFLVPTHISKILAQAKCYQAFSVKYVVPGTKNLRGTFKIYVPGREVQITGHIVDFDMELQMAVAVVCFNPHILRFVLNDNSLTL